MVIKSLVSMSLRFVNCPAPLGLGYLMAQVTWALTQHTVRLKPEDGFDDLIPL